MDEKEKMKKILEDFMNSDVYLNQKKILDEKRKTVKSGNNVVHIEYYKGILIDEDLQKYLTGLRSVKLDLSSFDKSGVAYNSLDDYTNLMSVVLSDELTKNIVFGIAGNAAWETIKIITKSIFNKVKHDNINVNSSGDKITKKEITFGLHLSLNKNTGFNFRLDSKFSNESIEKPLEQAIEFVKQQQSKEIYDHPLFLYYDHKKNTWIPVNMMEDINKKMKGKSKTSKKKK